MSKRAEFCRQGLSGPSPRIGQCENNVRRVGPWVMVSLWICLRFPDRKEMFEVKRFWRIFEVFSASHNHAVQQVVDQEVFLWSKRHFAHVRILKKNEVIVFFNLNLSVFYARFQISEGSGKNPSLDGVSLRTDRFVWIFAVAEAVLMAGSSASAPFLSFRRFAERSGSCRGFAHRRHSSNYLHSQCRSSTRVAWAMRSSWASTWSSPFHSSKSQGSLSQTPASI